MLIDEYCQQSPYTITELDFAYWVKKTSTSQTTYNFVFAPGRSVKGMYREKSTLAIVNGATVPIIQITTSMDDLFTPAPNPLPAPAAAVSPLYVLDSNGVKGAASTLQPGTGTIQTMAMPLQKRVLVSDGLRQYVYACSSKEIKYDLGGEPQAYVYTLLPQVAGTPIAKDSSGSTSTPVSMKEVAVNDSGYISIYALGIMTY